MKPKLRAVGVAIALALAFSYLSAQSLWRDHNPYNPSANIRTGTILKLHVEETVIIEYEYESTVDETVTIKLKPDQTVTEFLPPVDTEQNITRQNNDTLRSHGKIRFEMAVRVDSQPEEDIVSIVGTRQIAQENGRTRQVFQVRGFVHVEDIKPGRRVNSADVADLDIRITGAPVPQNRDRRLRQEPGATPEEPARATAELSDQEKQQLLLEYLNRVLGEMSDANR
ncbi:MAG: flagellar basal body L-ring protein FlgH [Spirochaetales bacterium]|nr:flagellar basal body L-ring protein FlgH [Leptospiraceae bacterium]MCP5480593.1 flagellar basal body L-ring protein FlgH [Spirochaetales bacterium]MCP5483943.1 flagellar basal body L-ring protein FlgH [Spirochaetales bacterium]